MTGALPREEGQPMPKGYWIAHVDFDNPREYAKYVAANTAAFAKYGAVCLARGGRAVALEGQLRTRNVIWEFPSLQHAIDCYNSPEYQHARSFRKDFCEGEFIALEGLDDGPVAADHFFRD